MQLSKITNKWLKQFADDKKIYQRGLNYNESGNVYKLEYDPKPTPHIIAEVSGNYGNYEVTISEQDQQIDSYCNCPYDGYPCKHIIAVLLDYIENKKEYRDEARIRKTLIASITKKLSQYSHDSLVRIIVEAAQNHPEFKLEIMATLEPDSKTTLELYMNRIRCLSLGDLEVDYSSELERIRELKRILKSIEKANAHIRYSVNWEIADNILFYLNQYCVSDDEDLENMVIQILETLTLLCSQESGLDENKQDLLKHLQAYYDWGNCCIVDYISDLIENLKN